MSATKKSTVRSPQSATRYRVLKGISCRVSVDPESGDYETFVSWEPGRLLDVAKAPAHLDVAFLLEDGAIEEVA